MLTSLFGLGYLPVMPGTWGTIGAVGVWWLLAPLSGPAFVAVTAGSTLVAIGLCHAAEKLYGSHDVQHIVIDEMVGLLATVMFVPFRLPQVVAAFLIFRLLDTLKPWPIRLIDAHMPGGPGVVLDDTAAGLVGCLLLHACRFFNHGWW